MRKPHILRGFGRTSIPRNIVYFDCESNQRKITNAKTEHTLRLGVACVTCRRDKGLRQYNRWFNFRTPADFWQGIMSRIEGRRKIIIVGYNAAYDFRLVDGFREGKRVGINWGSPYIAQQTLILKGRVNKSAINVIDAMNVFDGTLESWGRYLNLPKLKEDWRSPSDEVVTRYCHRDVEILKGIYETWITFVEENNAGPLRHTKAAQAFAVFRSRFNRHKVFIHSIPKVLNLERACYYGGRTECAFVGKVQGKQLHQLDINSMYPAVMASTPVPTKLIKSYRMGSIDMLSQQKGIVACSKVKVTTPHPVLPYRLKDGTLTFPTGSFTTSLAGPELQYALKCGMVREVYETSLYESGIIFADYVSYFYRMRNEYRKQGDELLAQCCKYFLNCLYGKFGERGETWKRVPPWDMMGKNVLDVFDTVTQVWERYVRIIDDYYYVTKESEGFNSFPAICAFITSASRLMLWEYINKVPRKEFFYCDTDSLIVGDSGLSALRDSVHPDTLGQLKYERCGTASAFHGPKDYSIGEYVKTKGVKKNAKRLSDTTVQQDTWEGLRGALSSGNLDRVIVTQGTKTLKRQYKKGHVSPSGWVLPFDSPDS